jgi:hypothetical protein
MNEYDILLVLREVWDEYEKNLPLTREERRDIEDYLDERIQESE